MILGVTRRYEGETWGRSTVTTSGQRYEQCWLCLEEVSMKWMDRPSVTEMERGGVYEMDRRKKLLKHGNATKMKKYNNTFEYLSLNLIKFDPFQWHFHFLALCLSIHFVDTSSIHFIDTSSIAYFKHKPWWHWYTLNLSLSEILELVEQY